jgi:Na+-transporting NADH:ubiquinone oxidoreductase subunit NqrB
MKSTQKFLLYSLVLAGTAIVFSMGCKKTTVDGPVYPVPATQQPVLNTGSNNPALTGTTSGTINATDWVASAGTASVTIAGFNFIAVGSSGSATPTVYPATASVTNTASWQAITTTAVQLGAFSSSLGTAAALAALSGSTTITWYVQSYVTSSAGTTKSALTQTIQTVN